MDKNNKNPAIRFTGYTADWLKGPVGDLLAERNSQSPKSLEYPLMAFVAYKGVAPKGDRYNREFLVNDSGNKKYKKSEYGDFIYSSNNLETGSIGLNNFGKASISPVYSIFHPVAESDSDFIGCLLSRQEFIQKLVRWRQGVVYGQWRIHETDFLNIDINYPGKEERANIGLFFRQLNTKIGLHSLKHEKLTTLKEAMLIKMFPQKGLNVPEIRFKGYNDAWEDLSFSKVFDLTTPTNSISRSGLTDRKGEIRNIHYGDILVKYGAVIDVLKQNIPFISDDCYSYNKNQLLKEGDIVIADAAEDTSVAKATEISNMKGLPIVAGLHTFVCRPKIDIAPFYLGHYLNSFSFREPLFRLFQGTKVLSISKTALSETIIKKPKSKNEQLKIGEYFNNIDKLINYHSNELSKLKSIKKACKVSMLK